MGDPGTMVPKKEAAEAEPKGRAIWLMGRAVSEINGELESNGNGQS